MKVNLFVHGMAPAKIINFLSNEDTSQLAAGIFITSPVAIFLEFSHWFYAHFVYKTRGVDYFFLFIHDNAKKSPLKRGQEDRPFRSFA